MSGFASFEQLGCQTVTPLHTNGVLLLVVIQLTWDSPLYIHVSRGA